MLLLTVATYTPSNCRLLCRVGWWRRSQWWPSALWSCTWEGCTQPHQRCIHFVKEVVLLAYQLLATLLGKCSSLCCSALCGSGFGFLRLAKPHTCRFDSGLEDLAIAHDDVDLMSSTVSKRRGDLPGALVPAHCHGAMVERFNEDDGLVRGHC